MAEELLRVERLRGHALGAEWPAWPLPGDATGAAGTRDAGELLWTDGAAGTPAANAARVLLGLRAALARARPLGGAQAEFLDLCDQLTAADREAFTHVWTDPRAYLWTRVAHRLAAACLHGTPPPPAAKLCCETLAVQDPREALARHLGEIKVFALAVAHRAGADRIFERPLVTALPLAIPGTRFSLDGAASVEVCGLTGGRLLVRAGGEEVALPLAGAVVSPPAGAGPARATPVLRVCPVARSGRYELPLHPHAFAVPGLAFGEPALRAGLPYQERYVALVERTLAAIGRYAPAAFEAFGRVIRMAALKPRQSGDYDDFSHAELPGAFIASVVDHPLELADHLIHELQHNRLQMIEESGPLLEGASGEEPRYYSPWRDKLRGLYGIFHGVYVFVGVYRFWREAYRAADVAPIDRAYVLDRVLRLPVQLALAVGVVRRHARLTALGGAILAQLERDVAAIRDDATRLDLPADAPALTVTERGDYTPAISEVDGRPLSVRASLLEHLRRNDVHGQCAGLPAGPEARAAP